MPNSVIWLDAKPVQSSSYPYYLLNYLVTILLIPSLHLFLVSASCLLCFLLSWDGVKLGPLGTSVTIGPIVPAPDDGL
jgi:hypothetical protein